MAARFELPSGNATNSSFVTSVKALVARKELLVQEGMAPTLLDDLKKMVSEFEATLETVLAARRDHIVARADLEVVTAELLRQVKVLDGITRYRFGMNPEMMAEWTAVRQVLGVRSRTVTAREQSDRSSPAGGTSTPGRMAPAA